MKILKKVLLLIFMLFLALGIYGFFLPKELIISRSLTINAPAAMIFPLFNRLKNWEQWSPWHKLDPKMTIIYSGDSGENSYYTWESANEDVGNGKITISGSELNKKITTEMDFMENGTAKGRFIFEETASNQTKVTWEMESDMGENPYLKAMGFFIDRLVGNDFEKGLAAVKIIAEQKANEKPLELPQNNQNIEAKE